jgi:DNA polymerase
MDGCLRVISRSNGPTPADVMLVGEAPGRRGAGRTGLPFSGDTSGQRLERLLAAAGWSRESVFITNAVLCNPTDAAGRNRPPTRLEIARCSHWLADQLSLVDPRLVVALGTVALKALSNIEPHTLRVGDVGRGPFAWAGRLLAPAYHPSARAAIHRPVEAQLADFQRFGGLLRRLNGGSDASR